MSNSDFKERLQRIGANPTQQHPMIPNAGRPRKRKPNLGLVGAGGAIMMIGIQVVKYANKNYEAIRDSSGFGTAAGLGLAGIAVFLLGIFVIIRGASKIHAAPDHADASQYSTNMAQPGRQPSNWARFFFSLLGFTLGTIACLYMFMAAAARFIETEKAEVFSAGAFLIAVVLAFVSLLFGLAGLFLRGYTLQRVPVYFLFGAVLTYATVRGFRINMLEWQQFMDYLK